MPMETKKPKQTHFTWDKKFLSMVSSSVIKMGAPNNLWIAETLYISFPKLTWKIWKDNDLDINALIHPIT